MEFAKKIQNLIFRWFYHSDLLYMNFFSKINNFTNLYAKLLKKKNLEPNSWFM